MNRRKFIGTSCKAMGSFTVVNTLLNMRLINNAIAAGPTTGNDYKALVVLIMIGGNDSFNTLIPIGDEYSNYAAVRDGIALPAPGSGGTDEIIPLNILNTPGRTFGLHGAMPHLAQRVNNGHSSFVANVGSLVEPTSITQYRNGETSLPTSLFSHNNQQDVWATSFPRGNNKSTGWAGRVADCVMAYNPSNQVSMNISLAGNQLALVGNDNFSFAITPNGSPVLSSASMLDQIRTNAVKSLAEQEQRSLLHRAFNHESKRAIDLSVAYNEAFNSTSLSTAFPSTTFGGSLEAIARTIGARNVLDQRRQIFVVQMGGFDTHGNQEGAHRGLLSAVDGGLHSFWNAIDDLQASTGLASDAVSLMTVSEFGRTLRTNGAGTDHAWGGHVFVEGGAVDGGKIFGQYPTPDQLIIGDGLDVGDNGRILPTTPIDHYYADLALWLGVPYSELYTVLPNLENFYVSTPTTPPLGIFA